MESESRQRQPHKNFQELLGRLALYELIEPLCKLQGESAYVASHNVETDTLTLSNAAAIDALRQDIGSKDSGQFKEWIRAHGLNTDEELIAYAQEKNKRKAVIADLLKGCGESLFLRYKDRLDRVLYSLIRLESSEQAHHLFYSIEANEIEFGDAAAQFSNGPESKTQGIVGPVDLTTPHPEIAARLRTAKPRQLFPPFKADQWHVLIRLEYRFDSEYDDKTKQFLGSLVLSAKAQEMTKQIKMNYLNQFLAKEQ
tara:strand:- start:321 stop:1085 length:765 start_codon:yes stop_codon:yes gene_type:complete